MKKISPLATPPRAAVYFLSGQKIDEKSPLAGAAARICRPRIWSSAQLSVSRPGACPRRCDTEQDAASALVSF